MNSRLFVFKSNSYNISRYSKLFKRLSLWWSEKYMGKPKKLKFTPKSPPIQSNDEAPIKNQFDFFTFHWRVFALFIVLVFSYFVFYSQKLTDIESKIYNNITEINVIHVPMPYGQLGPHKDRIYNYAERKMALREELFTLWISLEDNKLSESELGNVASSLHKAINLISYSFPFSKLFTFNKDGSVNFDPNNQITIETSGLINVPNLLMQINEINNWNTDLTIKLREKKARVITALALEPNVVHDKVQIETYIDSLLQYLENHHKLGLKLALSIYEHDYYAKKTSKHFMRLSFGLIGVCFIFGILLPFIRPTFQNSRFCTYIVLASFVLGVTILLMMVLSPMNI